MRFKRGQKKREKKREKKDFSFIGLTFAAFWTCSAAAPVCSPRDEVGVGVGGCGSSSNYSPGSPVPAWDRFTALH